MGAQDTGEEAAEPAVLARPGPQLAGVGSRSLYHKLMGEEGSVGPRWPARALCELCALCLDPRTRMIQRIGTGEWQLRVCGGP